MRGVIYVAYGEKALSEARLSIKSLKKHNPSLSVTVIADQALPGVNWIEFDKPGPGARWAKLMIDVLSPYEQTLYLDADTRIHGDITAGFEILRDWDIAIAPSARQGTDCLGHLPGDDKQRTLEQIKMKQPLNLQAGVLFFKKSIQVSRLFDQWRVEWSISKDQDQGALLRALWKAPVKVWLLSGEWNGGQLVEHRFGAAR
ncbi:MAG: hypothetical protein KDJ65_30740 [Anaerolineae bacterium]|nr:hypothetical protein [Anaerolineae bacterium]